MPKWQVILLGAVVGLTGACGSSASPQLSSQAEARIAEEVRATFQTMSDAIIALDLDQALALFDESAPPVHSVDGRIFVGIRGVWTLVFHRTPEGWRIVHSAATHGT